MKKNKQTSKYCISNYARQRVTASRLLTLLSRWSKNQMSLMKSDRWRRRWKEIWIRFMLLSGKAQDVAIKNGAASVFTNVKNRIQSQRRFDNCSESDQTPMKKIAVFVIIAVLVIAAGSYFFLNKSNNTKTTLTPFTVVLDWTPQHKSHRYVCGAC